jgi:hypothetical protein
MHFSRSRCAPNNPPSSSQRQSAYAHPRQVCFSRNRLDHHRSLQPPCLIASLIMCNISLSSIDLSLQGCTAHTTALILISIKPPLSHRILDNVLPLQDCTSPPMDPTGRVPTSRMPQPVCRGLSSPPTRSSCKTSKHCPFLDHISCFFCTRQAHDQLRRILLASVREFRFTAIESTRTLPNR